MSNWKELLKPDHTGTIIIKDGKRINPEDFYINNMTTKDIIERFEGEFLQDTELSGEMMIKLDSFFKSSLTELLDSEIERINQVKEAVNKNTGSYKYASCYDDCIDIINSHR